MKYLKQFFIILLISFIGEMCRKILPFPIPGSVYGMVLMFFLLCIGVVKLEQVKDVSAFLVEIMPVLFVPAGVGLMNSWNELVPVLIPAILIITIITVIVMVSAGWTTQGIIRILEKKRSEKEDVSLK